MADPLTSSDRLRERMGFGISPLAAPETRRAYAAAGLQPLTTSDRERFAAGAGISPMAGTAEKEAWKMAEYQAGERGQAPIEYGGIGDRPLGSSRRAIRMQDEWDKQRAQQIEEMKASQQMEMENRRLGLQERDQFIQEQEYNRKIKEYEAQQDIRGQSELESNNILDWIGGRAVDEQGNKIPKPDPKTPEFQAELLSKMAENPLGVEANKVIIDQYIGANKTYLDAQQAKQEKELQRKNQETQAKVGLARDLASAGKSISQFTKEDGSIDFESANVALGEAMKAGEEEKIIRAETREEKRNINSQISKIETDLVKIRGQVGRYQKLLETKKSAETQKELDAALVNQGILEDEINRLNRLRGGEAATQPEQGTTGQAEIQKFDSAMAAEAANLPAGTIIEINGRRARID